MKINTNITLRHKASAYVNQPLFFNSSTIIILVSLLVLLIFFHKTKDNIKNLEEFNRDLQRAYVLHDISISLARSRGIHSVINSLDPINGLLDANERLYSLIDHSIKKLGDETNYIGISKLKSCLLIKCYSGTELSLESNLTIHSELISGILKDASSLLLLSDESYHVLRDYKILKLTNIILESALYLEHTGRLRDRLSNKIAEKDNLDPVKLQQYINSYKKTSPTFKALSEDPLVKEVGISKYIERSYQHYNSIIYNVANGNANVVSTEFSDIVDHYIEDIYFFKNQAHQHLMEYTSNRISLYNEDLIKISCFTFSILLIFFVLLFNRMYTENQNTKHKNLKLNFLKKVLDEHAIVSMTDPRGFITYINEKFSEISGYQPEELIGLNHRIINSGTHDKAFFKNLWSSVHNNKPWSGEVCNRKKNGELYWVFATVLPLYNDDDELVSIISVRTDITNQKKNEHMLQIEKEKANSASKAKSDFLSNMSHEIRTPMNAIIGMTHLALRDTSDEKIRNYLNDIKLSANNLLGIVNDILDFSKIESGNIKVETIPFSLNETIRQVIELSKVRAKEKELPVLYIAPDDLVDQCIGDPLRINQILLNLMSNAIKFTNRGYVSLGVNHTIIDNDRVSITFSISDTGVGISKENQGYLFEKFTQENTSTTRLYGGTGLGLSISQKLANLMGSQITVESDKGKGSIFSFTLTLSRCGYEPIKNSLEDLRAIYIDNDKRSISEIECIFDAKGIYLHCYEDAKNAYEFIIEKAISKETAFDLVVINNDMPGINGVRFCRTLKNKLLRKNLPFIVLITNLDKYHLLEIIEEKPFDAIWLKPITASDITDTLHDFINNNDGILRRYLNSPINQKSIDQVIGAKVLIAEDNLINQKVISGLLKPYGLELTIVGNGEDAVNAIKKNSYDLVLMDIQMPVMDGLEAARQICSLEMKLPPIIAMTANVMPKDREECMRAGMSDYLSKPIDPSILKNMLYRWLKRDADFHNDVINYKISEEEKESSFGFIEGINMSVAFASVNKDPILLREILISFVEQYKNLDLSNLPQDEFARHLHTLKGLSATLGMRNLHIITSTLEQNLKTLCQIEPFQAALIYHEVSRLVKAIDRYINNQVGTSDLEESFVVPSIFPALEDLSLTQRITKNKDHRHTYEIAEKLMAQLSKGESDAQESALELMLAMQETLHAEDTAQILELTDSFDFDQALQILKPILDSNRVVDSQKTMKTNS